MLSKLGTVFGMRGAPLVRALVRQSYIDHFVDNPAAKNAEARLIYGDDDEDDSILDDDGGGA